MKSIKELFSVTNSKERLNFYSDGWENCCSSSKRIFSPLSQNELFVDITRHHIDQRSMPPTTFPPAEANSKCLRKWIKRDKCTVTHPHFSPAASSDLWCRDFLEAELAPAYLKVGFPSLSHLITFSIHIYINSEIHKICSHEYHSGQSIFLKNLAKVIYVAWLKKK